MCAKPEDIIDYRDLTPDEWQRERQQILTRAQAARAGAMRELGSALLHPWQAVLAVVRAYARWRRRWTWRWSSDTCARSRQFATAGRKGVRWRPCSRPTDSTG